MAITALAKERIQRRAIFERHLDDCGYCHAPISDQPGGAPAQLCMSGSIMLANYVRTFRTTESTEEES